jgi:hypothetical protein
MKYIQDYSTVSYLTYILFLGGGSFISWFRVYHILSSSLIQGLLLGSLPIKNICLKTVLVTGGKIIRLPIKLKVRWPKCLHFKIWKK